MNYTFKKDKYQQEITHIKLKRGQKKYLGDDIYYQVTLGHWYFRFPSTNFKIMRDILQEGFQEFFHTKKKFEIIDLRTNIIGWDDKEYEEWKKWHDEILRKEKMKKKSEKEAKKKNAY